MNKNKRVFSENTDETEQEVKRLKIENGYVRVWIKIYQKIKTHTNQCFITH